VRQCSAVIAHRWRRPCRSIWTDSQPGKRTCVRDEARTCVALEEVDRRKMPRLII
jgi:hypothetical protein